MRDDDSRVDQTAVELNCGQNSLILLVAGVVIGAQQMTHVFVGIATTCNDVEQHTVGNCKAAGQRLWRLRNDFVEGLLRPCHFALGNRLQPQLFQFGLVLAGTATQFGVFDFVFRCFDNYGALGVVASTPGASSNLVELA